MNIRIADIVESTTSDGPGFRTSIYCQGCAHNCPKCHNKETWDFFGGTLMDVQSIFDRIVRDSFSDVTFSGGDPLYQVDAFLELAKLIKTYTKKTIWCYTGFTWEQIVGNPRLNKILPFIDVLVDGRFVEALKDEDLLFRGSSNQRLIDVKKSLVSKQVEILDYDPYIRLAV